MKMPPLDQQAFLEMQILRHCNRFGFVTETISSALMGTTRRDYCKRLSKRGLLRLGKEYDDRPGYYLLTKAGYEIAQGCERFPLGHLSDSSKISHAIFYHELMLSHLTASLLESRAIINFLVPRRHSIQSKKYCEWKQFDAIHFKLTEKNVELSIGVEVENQDWKRNRHLDEFIGNISKSLRGNLVDEVAIYCNTDGKRDFYQRCFRNALIPSVLERIDIRVWTGDLNGKSK